MCSKLLISNICTLDIGFIDGSEKMFNQVCHWFIRGDGKTLSTDEI